MKWAHTEWRTLQLIVLTTVIYQAPAFCFHKPFRASRVSLPDEVTYCAGRRTELSMSRMRGDDRNSPYRGLRILELAGGLVPQGALVKTARTGWRELWKAMISELAPQSKDGAYQRPSYSFNGKISESSEFPVESGRYHLYTGNACPWCHRVLLVAKLRGLLDGEKGPFLTHSILSDDPERASRGGWAFDKSRPDPAFGCRDLREVYDLCSPGFTGRCTAPLLVDRKKRKIVSNDSASMMRMLNEIDPTAQGNGETSNDMKTVDLAPSKEKLAEMDDLDEYIYQKLSNGVYRCGFATTQAAYEDAEAGVFEALDKLEEVLLKSRFLAGDHLTWSDLRLFPTLVRFDAVYTSLFKCSRRRVADYASLTSWLRDVYQIAGVSETIDIPDCRRSYFVQLFPLNPSGIIPAGPTIKELCLTECPGAALGRGKPGALKYKK